MQTLTRESSSCKQVYQSLVSPNMVYLSQMGTKYASQQQLWSRLLNERPKGNVLLAVNHEFTAAP